jgi:uncharacterized protein YhaN
MRLRRLDLTRYGKFTDYSIDFGEQVPGTPDLHIIYGLNEAGKSTSLSAYLDLLFGIEERTKYGFLHQGKAMEIGASLEFDGQAHEFKRIKQRNNSLLNAQGQPANEATLGMPLAGLTRDAYRMMFSLDDQTLEDGGNAILESKGDLGELLFSASAGLAGISAILEAASTEADGIFRKRASSTKIAVLKRQIADLKSQRDEIDTQASAYRALTTELERAETAYDTVMKEISTARLRHDEIARILRAHPLLAEHHHGEEQLTHYADLPRPPEDWSAVLSDLVIDETRLQTQLANFQQQEQKLQDELDALVADSAFLAMAEQLDELADAAARYATAQEDLPKRKTALTEASRKVDTILATLGQSGIADPRTLLVEVATIGALRDLISAKSGIDVARSSAEREHEFAKQAWEKEKRNLTALDTPAARLDAGQIAQLQSVLGRLRGGNLTVEHRLAERSISGKRQVFDDVVNKLHPWTGDGEALRRITPPTTDRRDAWKTALQTIEQSRSKIIERQRELASKLEEDEARITVLRSAASIVDDVEAKAVFITRDEAWTEHLKSLDRESAAHFENNMRKADAVATARLDKAKELEELRLLTTEIAVTTASVERQRQLLQEASDDLDGLRGEIRSETPAEIVLVEDAPVASWLARITQWADNHSAALSAWDDLRQASNSTDEMKAGITTAQLSLAKALATVGIEADGLDIDATIQAADNLLTDHAAFQTKRADTDKRISEFEAQTIKRQSALDEATSAFEEWQRGWSSALATSWFADRQDSVGAVRDLLDVVATLPEALREQGDLTHRIQSMETNQASFTETVTRLYAALGETFDGDSPSIAAKQLVKRLDDARKIEATRLERDQSLKSLATQRTTLENEITLHSARKTEMADFFRVETLIEVRQQLERCAKRDKLAEQQKKLEQQIFSEMQVQSLEAAIEKISDTDLGELQQEQAELVTRLEDLDGRSKNLFADKARASDRLSAIGGDDAVARLEANRRTLLVEVEDLALRYLRLRSGSLIAEHGIRAYRDKHRSAMMTRASEAFNLITRGEYTGLATRPDKDREVLIALSKSGASKVAVELSKGTQFQLYLALRLAGYEEFAMTRPSVPFIADDIMETFDEPRSEEVFRLFGKMAQVGQVIYLTHHRHLCDLATRTFPFAKIHEISSVPR